MEVPKGVSDSGGGKWAPAGLLARRPFPEAALPAGLGLAGALVDEAVLRGDVLVSI